MEEFLTKKEVLKILGISLDTLNRWTRDGKLTKYKWGDGRAAGVRFKKSEIEAFIESRKF